MQATMKTRLLILSDTHATDYTPPTQHADVALHCGDLTEQSLIDEYRATINMLKSINAPLKLVIAGNHDFTLDIPMFKQKVTEIPGPPQPELVEREYGDYGEARQLFEKAREEHSIIFLDEGLHHFDLANGASLTVYASPFTPSLGDWGFQYHPDNGRQFAIEKGVDIVMTHGPPQGILDRTYSRQRAGCPELFAAVARARPKLHCFGHIHEQWGAKLITWRDNSRSAPAYFTAIDNDKSTLITDLSRIKGSELDEPGMREAKAAKLHTSERDGCYSTSHCANDSYPITPGTQTLMVNASIKGNGDNSFHLPWLVDIELPKTP
ncbi:hypothetical protein FQN49_000521 [Arthroderma sp. PD_2]|nr:hypothetical protein FQN49_000521 [Arthroderma sp. PD_2]